MSIISRFNVNYHSKILNDYLKNQNHKGFLNHLSMLAQSKKETFVNLVHKFMPIIHEDEPLQTQMPNKIIWINSYNINDTAYISHFLYSYLQNHNRFVDEPKSYSNRLASISYLLGSQNIELDKQLFNHSFYQILINFLTLTDQLLTNSCSAFFETDDKKYFTYSFTTSFYIYFIRNPISLYSDLKKNQNQKNAALNELFNLEKRPHIEKINGLIVEENKQGWQVNVSSWIDANVLSSFRGLIVHEEEIIENPVECLSKIIIHYNQSNLPLNLNYDFIENYIRENPIPFLRPNLELSNNELKLINRELGALKNELMYQF